MRGRNMRGGADAKWAQVGSNGVDQRCITHDMMHVTVHVATSAWQTRAVEAASVSQWGSRGAYAKLCPADHRRRCRLRSVRCSQVPHAPTVHALERGLRPAAPSGPAHASAHPPRLDSWRQSCPEDLRGQRASRRRACVRCWRPAGGRARQARSQQRAGALVMRALKRPLHERGQRNALRAHRPRWAGRLPAWRIVCLDLGGPLRAPPARVALVPCELGSLIGVVGAAAPAVPQV